MAGAVDHVHAHDRTEPIRCGDRYLNDCCGGWQIHGFVCEHYAAPDTFAIGLNRGYSDAEAFCQSQYNGHLASIHTQHDYDKLMTMATGYTLPILVGGRLDDGEWSWEDGSFFDLDFITAHSWDQLGSGKSAARLATQYL